MAFEAPVRFRQLIRLDQRPAVSFMLLRRSVGQRVRVDKVRVRRTRAKLLSMSLVLPVVVVGVRAASVGRIWVATIGLVISVTLAVAIVTAVLGRADHVLVVASPLVLGPVVGGLVLTGVLVEVLVLTLVRGRRTFTGQVTVRHKLVMVAFWDLLHHSL